MNTWIHLSRSCGRRIRSGEASLRKLPLLIRGKMRLSCIWRIPALPGTAERLSTACSGTFCGNAAIWTAKSIFYTICRSAVMQRQCWMMRCCPAPTGSEENRLLPRRPAPDRSRQICRGIPKAACRKEHRSRHRQTHWPDRLQGSASRKEQERPQKRKRAETGRVPAIPRHFAALFALPVRMLSAAAILQMNPSQSRTSSARWERLRSAVKS